MSKQKFDNPVRKCKQEVRDAIESGDRADIAIALNSVKKMLRSKVFVGQRAKRLRGMRRVLEHQQQLAEQIS